MRKLMIALVAATLAIPALAATDPQGNTVTPRGAAMKECGQHWKEYKAQHPDVKGAAAWQTFRKENCASKRKRSDLGMVIAKRGGKKRHG